MVGVPAGGVVVVIGGIGALFLVIFNLSIGYPMLYSVYLLVAFIVAFIIKASSLVRLISLLDTTAQSGGSTE